MGAALAFLEGNGVRIPEATSEPCDAIIEIAERRVGKAELAALFRRLAS